MEFAAVAAGAVAVAVEGYPSELDGALEIADASAGVAVVVVAAFAVEPALAAAVVVAASAAAVAAADF